MRMTKEKDYDETETGAELEQVSYDEPVLFQTILGEVRCSNFKDRTRLLIDAINDDLTDMLQAINKYNKDGQMKITLKFKCIQANEMQISAELETKKPKGNATGTKMYRDLKGRLFMDDPNQTKLFPIENVHKIK